MEYVSRMNWKKTSPASQNPFCGSSRFGGVSLLFLIVFNSLVANQNTTYQEWTSFLNLSNSRAKRDLVPNAKYDRDAFIGLLTAVVTTTTDGITRKRRRQSPYETLLSLRALRPEFAGVPQHEVMEMVEWEDMKTETLEYHRRKVILCYGDVSTGVGVLRQSRLYVSSKCT
ncbi:hypothetical protein PROFUN_08954 [Planoprotostelium fungivorum]|uniref:Uncharacterized protein n=1 Tax=Planoprotostelium fungivorum TaxID=1890364 RepID=A0A2P6NIT0_9EUKA|nr:hypothetical protein PROFUN_08954 [Planoprotostelium fungivorum]